MNARKIKLCGKKWITTVLAMILVVSMLPVNLQKVIGKERKVSAVTELNNPRIEKDSSMDAGQKVTWDCIYFGSYPQTEIVDEAETSGAYGKPWEEKGDYEVNPITYEKLKNAEDWDDNGDIELDGNKYRRISVEDRIYNKSIGPMYYEWGDSTYHFFRYERIKWRVLNIDGKIAFLLADRALDDQKYNQEYTSITWETSTIRKWLNGYTFSENNNLKKSFFQSAFSAEEQKMIVDTEIVNKNNLTYQISGGNDTTDKIFLLSESEVYTDNANKYGFVSEKEIEDEARRSKSTTYAKAMGTISKSIKNTWGCWWWLRSPGSRENLVEGIFHTGSKTVDYFVYGSSGGVRPALRLDISLSYNNWSYAGTVCSDGTENNKEELSTIPESEIKEETINPSNLEIMGNTKANLDSSNKAAALFPSNWQLSANVIPVQIKKETNIKDGSYTLKVTIGIVDIEKDWSGKEKWNKYKKQVEQVNKALKKDENSKIMETLKGSYKIKELSGITTDKFEKLPKVKFMGYGEYKYDKNGNLISSDKKFASDCKWEGSITNTFATPIGPVYIQLKGGAKISGNIGVEYEFTKNAWKFPDGDLKITPNIGIEGGYGISKVATLGAYGKADFPIQVLPWGKFSMKASGGLHLYLALVIDWEYDIGTINVDFWDGTKTSKQARMLQTGTIKPLDISFADKTSKWNLVSSRRKARSTALNNKTILQEGILTTSMPVMKEINGKKVMIFQAYDQTRQNTLNSPVLKYSVYENGAWSIPKDVWNTDTADMYADFQEVNGKLVLTWQKLKNKIDGDVSSDANSVMKDIAKNSEICYAEFDPNTNSFTKNQYVTENNSVDMMPKFCQNTNNVEITYVKNTTNDLMQEDGKNEIYTKTLNNSTFSAEKKISSSESTIEQYVSYKKDNETQTAQIGADKNNHMQVYDKTGAKISTLSDDTQNGISGIEYQSGNIFYNVDGVMYKYNTDSGKTTSFTAGDSLFGSDAKYYSNGDKEAFLWESYDKEDDTTKLMVSIKTDQGFSEPVELYKEEGNIYRTMSALMDSKGDWDILANAYNTSEKLNTLVELSAKTKDEVDTETITVDEQDKNDNNETAVDFTVKNVSEKKLDHITVCIENEDGDMITKEVSVEIEPGQTVLGTTYMDLTAIKTSQDVKLYCKTDEQTVSENDKEKQEIGQADIELRSAFSEEDDKVKITLSAVNNGDKDATTTLHIYSDENNSKELYKSQQLNVKTGKAETIETTINKSEVIYNKNNAAYLRCYAEVEGGDYSKADNESYVILYKKQESNNEPSSTENKPATPTTESKPTTTTEKKSTTTANKKKVQTIKVNGVAGFKVTSKAKKTVQAKWKKTKEISGYQLQYTTNSKFKKGIKTKVYAKTKKSVKLKKLKSKKKYYFRIRAYKVVNGKKVYSKWSSKKAVRIR